MTRGIGGGRQSTLRSSEDDASKASFLAPVFDQFERADIRYALLRMPEGPADEAAGRYREIDLLVLPDQLPALARVLGRLGFVEAPRWGYQPHHFFFAFDECGDVWWKLDVVTELLYGHPLRALRGGDALTAIARMRANHLLAQEDEFAGLLLHCILDHGAFAPRHCRQLLSLWKAFETDATLRRKASRQVRHRLEPAVTWDMLECAAGMEDWESLLARRRALKRQLFFKHPVQSLWRILSGHLARAARPVLVAARHRGVTITLLGPDGAGKTTLGRALAAERPLRGRVIYMGLNPESATVSLGITRWLGDRQGDAATSRKLTAPLRWAAPAGRLAEQWYRYAVAHYHRARGRLIVLDRYPYELQERGGQGFSRRFRKMLFKAGAPKPDLIVVLDAPATTLQQRKAEHGLVQLERMRQDYLDLPSRFANSAVIDTTVGHDAVRRRVTSRIWEVLGGDPPIRRIEEAER